jgi:hypothetical protein
MDMRVTLHWKIKLYSEAWYTCSTPEDDALLPLVRTEAVKQQLPMVQEKQLKTPLPLQQMHQTLQQHLLSLTILQPHHNLQVLSQLPPLAETLRALLPTRYNRFTIIHAYVLIFISESLLNT